MGIIASNFMIMTKDNIYEIYMDMQISEINKKIGYTAMGSGSPFALGSLYTSGQLKQSKKTPKERIGIALDCASNFAKNCGKPFSVYSWEEAMKKIRNVPYSPPPEDEKEE
jgi:ATP-dependent protease HslVU (ClpYQ) peptidase subunit